MNMTHIQMTESGKLQIILNNGAIVICDLPSHADGEVLNITDDNVRLTWNEKVQQWLKKHIPMEAEGQ